MIKILVLFLIVSRRLTYKNLRFLLFAPVVVYFIRTTFRDSLKKYSAERVKFWLRPLCAVCGGTGARLPCGSQSPTRENQRKTQTDKPNERQKSGTGATASDGDAEDQPHGNRTKKRKALFIQKPCFVPPCGACNRGRGPDYTKRRLLYPRGACKQGGAATGSPTPPDGRTNRTREPAEKPNATRRTHETGKPRRTPTNAQRRERKARGRQRPNATRRTDEQPGRTKKG